MVVSERRNGGVPVQTSQSQVCLINNNRALVIVCNAILVDEQVIEVNVH